MKILSLSLVKILKLKFDQDLCKNLWYELNPRVRCAFGNVFVDNGAKSKSKCCNLKQLSIPTPPPPPLLSDLPFVWYICFNHGLNLYLIKCISPFTPSIVSMLSPHIITTSVLYICWSRPNPLYSFSSSVNVFDWLKSHADAFSFAASKKQTQTRRGSSDLPISKAKTKEDKTQKEFENKRKYFRKFMSVFSCQS